MREAAPPHQECAGDRKTFADSSSRRFKTQDGVPIVAPRPDILGCARLDGGGFPTGGRRSAGPATWRAPSRARAYASRGYGQLLGSSGSYLTGAVPTRSHPAAATDVAGWAPCASEAVVRSRNR